MSHPGYELTSPSARLRFKIALAAGRLQRTSARFWRHPEIEVLLPELLVVLHASVRATVPLLEEAGRYAAALGDELGRALAEYYFAHAAEERHHDSWLLDDIESLGIAAASVTAALPPSAVASLIGAQYYWIRHSHPIALLGCFAVLEGHPPRKLRLDAVAARTALPRSALRTFYKHAELDPQHRSELNALLDRLPLRAQHEALMGLSALHSIAELTRIVEGVLMPFRPESTLAASRSRRQARRPGTRP